MLGVAPMSDLRVDAGPRIAKLLADLLLGAMFALVDGIDPVIVQYPYFTNQALAQVKGRFNDSIKRNSWARLQFRSGLSARWCRHFCSYVDYMRGTKQSLGARGRC